QGADDVVQVAAGAEIAAVGQEDHRIDVVGVAQRAEGVAQLGIGLESERVLALRAAQPHARHLALDLPQEVLGLEAGHLGHSRPSQLLRKAFSIEVNCRASVLVTSASRSPTQRSCAAAIVLKLSLPDLVRRTIDVRRSPLRWPRCTSPSATSRSTMPVTLPLDTSRKRDRSLISMPSGVR